MENVRVVVADDNIQLRELIAEFLAEQAGLEVAGAAANGMEALKLVEEKEPDVLICDMIMPQMDGYTVRERLQGMHLAHRPGVIALTALGRDDFIARAINLGVHYYMVKPFDLMNVRMDANGQVALLSANTMRMNQLANKAGEAAQHMLKTMSSEQVSVPLGAALGLTIFAGSGPDIPVSIVPVGSITTNFVTEFEACGINQTRHKVYLTITAKIRIVIPNGAKTTEVTVNMLAAESIIVGAVPEGFVGYDLTEAEMNLVP